MNGYDGTTSEIKLVKPGYAKCSFDRATTASFDLRAEDVGYIHSITVRIVRTVSDILITLF